MSWRCAKTEAPEWYDAYAVYKAFVFKKIKRGNGKKYYNPVEVKRVNGKVVTRHVAYLGKTPKSIQELAPEHLLPYVQRLLDMELTDVDMARILKKMGVETDVWPVTRLIIENDLSLGISPVLNRVFVVLCLV